MNTSDLQLHERAAVQRDRLTRLLLDQFTDGHWSGELSSSALSTAVAIIALRQMVPAGSRLVEDGLAWLAQNANPDGGWGDTIRSKSNISTTALCWAAFGAAQADSRYRNTVDAAEHWLIQAAGSLEQLAQTISSRYGKDRTFSVPILVSLAISGRLKPAGWRDIPALPFELAVLPRRFFGALRLPVVSYALPALIAIGNVIHHHAPSPNPVARALRARCAPRALALLTGIQPPNGGFLEAIPLTAFVTMSLAAAGLTSHIVAQRAASFLRASVRPDGSWPIDTNLATWVTTLSIKALSHENAIPAGIRGQVRDWLEAQQTRTIHSYTGSPRGGWAWTDLPGGVPDADDTAGALVALHHLSGNSENAGKGIEWLLNVQNSDGGIPTFCRGWGTLPFDRGTPEITAHALSAFSKWKNKVNPRITAKMTRVSAKALRFLERNQRADGAFIPLWFGNEHTADESNPLYGTAQVLIALNEIQNPQAESIRSKAAQFVIRSQNPRGGWGADRDSPPSIEETSLALEALSGFPEHSGNLRTGMEHLLASLEEDRWREPAPIGLYFARLWYFERTYPLIFAVSALGKFTAQLNRRVSAAAAIAF